MNKFWMRKKKTGNKNAQAANQPNQRKTTRTKMNALTPMMPLTITFKKCFVQLVNMQVKFDKSVASKNDK